jgi:hypothetical protein
MPRSMGTAAAAGGYWGEDLGTASLHRQRSCGFIFHKESESVSFCVRRVVREIVTMDTAQKSYDEIIDLFARGTTPDQILAFRPSRESRERVEYLLARNKTDKLTEEEAAELDRFGELEHLMQLVKARAHLYAGQTT